MCHLPYGVTCKASLTPIPVAGPFDSSGADVLYLPQRKYIG